MPARRINTAIVIAITGVLAMTGCTSSTTPNSSSAPAPEARAAARVTLEAVTKVGALDWPEIKAGTASDCQGGNGVLFTWAMHTAGPGDVRSYVDEMQNTLAERGYQVTVSTTDAGARGTLYTIGGSGDDLGTVGIRVSGARTSLLLDSACAQGKQEDYL